MTKYGGRRFCLVVSCSLAYIVLLINGYIDGSQYIALQLPTIGAYITGNGAQKYTEAKYKNGNP